MTVNRETPTAPIRANAARVSIYLARHDDTRGIRTARDNRARRSGLGDTVLQAGLAHFSGTSPADWLIGRTYSGGPIVRKAPAPDHDLHISLSDSGELIVAGICNRAPLGIDIERCRPRRFSAIAAYLDWPETIGTLDSDRFYHAWTLWESTIKVCAADDRPSAASVFRLLTAQLAVGTPVDVIGQSWFARSWRYCNSYWLSAVSALDTLPEVRIFRLERLNSDIQTSQISEMTSENGQLDPEIRTPGDACRAGEGH
jgi:hypothetical protein